MLVTLTLGTAYAAINTLRLDDMNPHIYRTHDGGKTWQQIVNGIPGGAPVNVVREDPKRKGLLYAGTERAVYVSFDDGDNWQSLRLNMPATSIRDLIVKDNDLAVGTHGRGFWILDDITPLRQVNDTASNGAAFLFKPAPAVRVRWNMNTDTPLPPDEPAAENPPDGAVIHYMLAEGTTGPVKLEILDAAGKVVRGYSSEMPVRKIDPMSAVPLYWERPANGLSATPGLHRFRWDLHYQLLPRGRTQLPISAVIHNTAPVPNSPWVAPGTYTVKLIVAGKSYTQPIVVKMDPRVHAPLDQQFALSKGLYDDIRHGSAAIGQIRKLREDVDKAKENSAAAGAKDSLDAISKKLVELQGAEAGGFGGGGGRGGAPAGPDTLASVNGSLAQLMQTLQGADVVPTTQVVKAVAEKRAVMSKLMARWRAVQTADLVALNTQLSKAGLPTLAVDKKADPDAIDDDDGDDDIG